MAKKVAERLEELGWREWLYLPNLMDCAIKAKVDTGAKTSALHAYYIEPFMNEGSKFVKFRIHPRQNDSDYAIECTAPLVDRREVSDSGGHREMRYVIRTDVAIGSQFRNIEITLTDRDSMIFRMLLGRNALKGNYLVNSNSSFILGGSSKSPPMPEFTVI